MATRDNEMQQLKVRDVEELGHARISGNAGNLAGASSNLIHFGPSAEIAFHESRRFVRDCVKNRSGASSDAQPTSGGLSFC